MYIALFNKIETYPFTSVLQNLNSKSQDKQLKMDEKKERKKERKKVRKKVRKRMREPGKENA